MHVTRLLAVAAVLAVSVGITPGARAADGTHLDCAFAVHLAFEPGISPELKAIRITSPAPGPLSCTGTWAGQPVAGAGLATFEGDALGTCAGSTIDAVVRMDHPLAGGGRFRLAVPLRSGRVGTGLYAASDDPAQPALLFGTGTPDPGQNCITTPITGIRVKGRMVVGSVGASRSSG
jgi:hypothetical protein